ncbi:hypothetical protein Aph01nite_25290 [Acrocarpospora phusangensis]|uniref:Uncharacterized protein n=1 Tax=Acrocarpospora phusangensis TaxID=1070424 RepID=A0A919QAL9_9ACTN|nr:hypothetical protein [Acrocarpospora phusangensis]GIH24219.1 hypothetical protein Aph01nite_25290 [Acrocarpospora phusangensis]
MPRRWCSLLGLFTVAPWLLVSVQNLADDAPDGTSRSILLMLTAQSLVLLAFAATWTRWRAVPPFLAFAVVAYALAAAFAAIDNNGDPILAVVLFTLAPAMAALPIVLTGRTAAATG